MANEGRYEEAEQLLEALMPVTNSLFEEIRHSLRITGLQSVTSSVSVQHRIFLKVSS